MRANKTLLLVASLATLLALGAAAWQENIAREWRGVQRAYRARLAPEAAREFSVLLRQIVVPRLSVTDRCVSCHVGMAPGESALAGDPVFGSHPDVVHDPAEFGCVVCHGGQGRATERADAHGEVHFWPEPMLPAEMSWAGCGACHTHLAVPSERRMEAGRLAFERLDCLACHAVDGRGGTLRPDWPEGTAGPDLSRAGSGGYDPGWYDDHLTRHERAAEGPWRSAFGPVAPAEREALGVFLASRSGARGLVEAKALFHSLGCRGCHKIAGVGGDDGPELTRAGQKDPGRLDFSHVPSGRTLPDWLAEHFRAPATVVPGSAMPALGLTEPQIETLTFYMMSLRRSEFPEAYWPKDRIRAERFGEREFATDGATLYGAFCAACHGPRGEGMRYPGASAFPAIGNPDFLAIAPEGFIEQTVRRGRPGRRMPAWGESEGGLRPAEIAAVAEHVRSFGDGLPEAAPVPDPRPARWAAGDVALGGHLYAENCAACHGGAGEGKEGPALALPAFLDIATDTYIAGTIGRGRRGTSMPAFVEASTAYRALSAEEIEAIVAFIRTWETTP